MPFATPVEIPGLAERYGRELNWGGEVVKSCVHCHQIGEAFRAWHRDRGEAVPLADIFPMPAAETIGLSLAPDYPARVTAVAVGSTAAAAGFQVGDDLVAMAGQPLISVADFSWVLHRFGESGEMVVTVQRGGTVQTLQLALSAGWRTKADISRRVGTWSMRAMALGGMVLTDLDDTQRRARGLGTEGMAIFVKGLGQYGKHGAVLRVQQHRLGAGLRVPLRHGVLVEQLLQEIAVPIGGEVAGARAPFGDALAGGAVHAGHAGADGPGFGAGVTRIDVERHAAARTLAGVATGRGRSHGWNGEDGLAGAGVAPVPGGEGGAGVVAAAHDHTRVHAVEVGGAREVAIGAVAAGVAPGVLQGLGVERPRGAALRLRDRALR